MSFYTESSPDEYEFSLKAIILLEKTSGQTGEI